VLVQPLPPYGHGTFYVYEVRRELAVELVFVAVRIHHTFKIESTICIPEFPVYIANRPVHHRASPAILLTYCGASQVYRSTVNISAYAEKSQAMDILVVAAVECCDLALLICWK
jgi:hypothetical protein